MKDSEIVTVILIAIIGTVAAYYGINNVLKVDDKKYSYTTLNPVKNELVAPDPEVFNPGAINPTVEVFTGNCVDKDKNGIIDPTELSECIKAENARQSQSGGNQSGTPNSSPSTPSPQTTNPTNNSNSGSNTAPAPSPAPSPVPNPTPSPTPTPTPDPNQPDHNNPSPTPSPAPSPDPNAGSSDPSKKQD